MNDRGQISRDTTEIIIRTPESEMAIVRNIKPESTSDDSGAWRRMTQPVLLWLCMALLGAISGIGIYLWTRNDQRLDTHDESIQRLKESSRATDVNMIYVRQLLEEVRSDMKSLIRKNP